MSIRKIGLFVLVLLAAASVNAQTTSQDQGTLVVNAPNVQKREVGAFHGVDVSNAIYLIIKQGDEDAVAVSASDVAVRNRIVTRVDNGILHISLDTKGFSWKWNDRKMKAFVSIKTLSSLDASGSSDVYVDGSIHSEDLDISLSGASDFKGTVIAGQLQMHQSGSSDANVKGSASNVRIHLSGASDFKGYDITVDNCSVESSGSSDVQITVNKELKVSASGSSDVYYKGDGVVKEVNTSGSSSVTKKS
jgi:hypothetical protein